jgi:hypothetical protein
MNTLSAAVLSFMGLATSNEVALSQKSSVENTDISEISYIHPRHKIGFFNPDKGYWTGDDWDYNWFEFGHGGYGKIKRHYLDNRRWMPSNKPTITKYLPAYGKQTFDRMMV